MAINHRAGEYVYPYQKCLDCGEVLIDDSNSYTVSGQRVNRSFDGTAWPTNSVVACGNGIQSLSHVGRYPSCRVQ